VPGLGARAATLSKSGIFGVPILNFTVMQGSTTLHLQWFSEDFQTTFSENPELDVRAGESVRMTESAPRIDDLSLLPGAAGKQIRVTGRVSDPDGIASLTVNGRKVKPRRDGSFKRKVKLPPGDSTLTVIAADRAGHSLTRMRPVHRLP